MAENVKIGDPLALVVSIDDQDIYGMHVTSCTVRDGLGWSDQDLINGEGCPLDTEIMGELEHLVTWDTGGQEPCVKTLEEILPLETVDGDSEEEDDDWGDWRRKRDTGSGTLQRHKRHVENGVDLRMLDHDSITKAKAAFVDCECEWGLFRYRVFWTILG